MKCGLIGDWELTSQHKNREGVIFVASDIGVCVSVLVACNCEVQQLYRCMYVWKSGRRMESNSKGWSCRVLVENVVKEKWGEESKDEGKTTVTMANHTDDDRINTRTTTKSLSVCYDVAAYCRESKWLEYQLGLYLALFEIKLLTSRLTCLA